MKGSASSYTGSLIISPLADQNDNDTYTCTVTVTGGTNVQPVNNSDNVTITVLSKNGQGHAVVQSHLYLRSLYTHTDLPPPNATISGATVGTAGYEFQLTCIMTVVDHLIANSTRTIQWSGGSVGLEDDVTESNTSHDGMRTLTFSPLRTSHGAEYICQAEINISSASVMKTDIKHAGVIVQSK